MGGVIPIYCCNEVMMCGGLCDRLQGIVSLYKICKANNKPFKIWFDNPFNLNEILMPNIVDWTIHKEDINLNKSEIEVLYVPIMYEKFGMTYKEECQYQIDFFAKFFKKMENAIQQLHVYTNAHLAIYEEFSALFNELFIPSPLLQEYINKNLQIIGSEYISATFRFQNLLGDFKEASSSELSIKDKEEYVEKCLIQLCNLHKKHPNKKILVTADSMRFCRIAQQTYQYVYIIPGELVHMSYSKDVSLSVYLKSFVDLFMIANASKLYLLLTGKMYHSGFAQTASFIYNKPYEVIKF